MAEAGAVTPAMVDGYRFCQLARGWESGILRFAEARLAGAGAQRGWRGTWGASGMRAMLELLAVPLASSSS